MPKRMLVLLLAAGLLTTALVYSQFRHQPQKVSGFVEADEIRLGSRVGGRVIRVGVEEGQTVKAGDKLIELAPFDLLARRAQALAELAARQAELQRCQAGPRVQQIAQAQAARSRAAAMVELAALKAKRVNEMFARNAATPDEHDTTAQEWAAAQADLEQREQALAELKAGSRQEDIAQAQAAADAAQAAVSVLDRQIDELTIIAPVDGVVEALDLQPGDLVAPNAPMMSLMNTRNLWVRAYVPEDRLDLALGQTLPVSVDSHPDRRFTGHVSFVSRQAEFTPNNVQTPEDRAKQVFRIKVTLDDGHDLLRPGMSADVWLQDRQGHDKGPRP
jgi:multidrug resistance efflux pump